MLATMVTDNPFLMALANGSAVEDGSAPVPKNSNNHDFLRYDKVEFPPTWLDSQV